MNQREREDKTLIETLRRQLADSRGSVDILGQFVNELNVKIDKVTTSANEHAVQYVDTLAEERQNVEDRIQATANEWNADRGQQIRVLNDNIHARRMEKTLLLAKMKRWRKRFREIHASVAYEIPLQKTVKDLRAEVARYEEVIKCIKHNAANTNEVMANTIAELTLEKAKLAKANFGYAYGAPRKLEATIEDLKEKLEAEKQTSEHQKREKHEIRTHFLNLCNTLGHLSQDERSRYQKGM